MKTVLKALATLVFLAFSFVIAAVVLAVVAQHSSFAVMFNGQPIGGIPKLAGASFGVFVGVIAAVVAVIVALVALAGASVLALLALLFAALMVICVAIPFLIPFAMIAGVLAIVFALGRMTSRRKAA